MSYILEALKKSEQERGHGGSPGIQTIHSSSLNYRANRKPLWPWLLVVILVANLVVLVYFMLDRSDSVPVVRPAAVSIPSTKPVSIPASTQYAPAPDQQPVVAVTPQPKTAVMAPPVAVAPRQVETPVRTMTPAPVPAVVAVIELDELPPDVGSHVPDMKFSAHVYSDNPRQRSIVINGMFLEEGELLSSDLALSEITPDGAIFEFRGYRFRRGVLSGW